MTIVAQVIKNKAVQSIFTISPNATVLEAIKIMADKGVGALVVAEDEKVVGIFSERDYTRKIALMERTSESTLVSDIMTSKVSQPKPYGRGMSTAHDRSPFTSFTCTGSRKAGGFYLNW